MKQLLRYKNILAALAIILLFVLVDYQIYAHYSQKVQDLEEKSRQLEQGKEVVSQWLELNSQFNKLAEFFLQKDTLLFKKLVEEKAKSSGVDILSLSISSSDKGFYWEVTLPLQVLCSYEAFLDFVRILEKNKIQLEQLRITTSKDKRDNLAKIRIEGNLKGIVLK